MVKIATRVNGNRLTPCAASRTKIVVITGGTSGIGLAAAKQFIKEGAKVVVTGRSPSP